MNIYILIILLSVMDFPTLPEKPRANRRASRSKAINHNRCVYHDVIGSGIWFELPHEDGIYRRHASGHHHTNSQQGRWENERLSGHRRFEKWCRDYYPSRTDKKAVRRWDEELKEYLNS